MHAWSRNGLDEPLMSNSIKPTVSKCAFSVVWHFVLHSGNFSSDGSYE